jgi:hypothetical protein
MISMTVMRLVIMGFLRVGKTEEGTEGKQPMGSGTGKRR